MNQPQYGPPGFPPQPMAPQPQYAPQPAQPQYAPQPVASPQQGMGGPVQARPVNPGMILGAPMQTKYGQSLQDDNGRYDGDYEITIRSCEVGNTDKGQVFRVQFRVDASTNPEVAIGSEREHPFFWWSAAARSETHSLWALFAERLGRPLDEATATTFYDGSQSMAGTRWHLNVHTRPQKNDKSKTFSHHTYRALRDDESLGLQSSAPAQAQPAMPPAFQQAQAQPAMPPAFPQAPAPAPAPGVGQLSATPPPGWPPNMPWPGAQQ